MVLSGLRITLVHSVFIVCTNFMRQNNIIYAYYKLTIDNKKIQ